MTQTQSGCPDDGPSVAPDAFPPPSLTLMFMHEIRRFIRESKISGLFCSQSSLRIATRLHRQLPHSSPKVWQDNSG